ncbi:unnamed protein product [Lactuca virosa]|uniref:Retrotransposon Copia-like N-terminal domain-containing protein n=1 Tax=Lactuca virosa TaxID=75947 RepID=A0AAU9PL87_9ASTR|nr:unnamed protein product [Lactuca virosa]
MKGLLNPPDVSSTPAREQFTYTADTLLNASNANISSFVSVRLSSDETYPLWKTQMLCILKIHNMVGLVDDTVDHGPTASTVEIMDQYNTLLKGWIFGSINQNLLIHVFNLDSVKDVWRKLQNIYDPPEVSEEGDNIVQGASHDEQDVLSDPSSGSCQRKEYHCHTPYQIQDLEAI